MQPGKYQSGQMGQTVNLLAYAFGGSNPSLPTIIEKDPIDYRWGFLLYEPIHFIKKKKKNEP